jgi:hypothetical protein
MTKTIGSEQMVRLEAKIIKLGGKIPAPWPWAILKRRGTKVVVDVALRNLQLLELVEDLEAKSLYETQPKTI